MISEKLLGKVFGDQKVIIGQIDNDIEYVIDGITSRMNIYEVMYKCKEWAINKHKYRLLTEPYNDYGYIDWMVEATLYGKSNPKRFSLYKSEPEAVFKACEWILENE